MKCLIVAAALLVWGSRAIAGDPLINSMLDVQKGVLAPMQMPDGSKLWRFARKPQKQDTDAILESLIAQALATAHWCDAGWAETSRTNAMGTLIVEGRCK